MDRPNIVLLVLDAVRPDHLSVYGHQRSTTPKLDALSEDAIVYHNAFANSNWTGTSHATVFTGRLPSDTGVHGGNQELPDDRPTLPEVVHDAGYRTFGMSAGAHVRGERGYDRGFETFKETYRISFGRDFLSGFVSDPSLRHQSLFSVTRGPDKKALYKFNSLKQWIKQESNPFFAFINAKTAHHPYNPPRPHKSRFCPELRRPRYQFVEELLGDERDERQFLPNADWDRLQRLSYEYPVISGEFSPTSREWETIQAWYDGAVHYLDYRVGEFVDWLRNMGQLKNTCLIITADHGEYFGEHGLEKHYYGLYEPVVRVPLIMLVPHNAGRDINSIVSLADLYPTIVHLATGTEPDYPHAHSLLPFDDRSIHDHVFAELGAVAPDGILNHHPEFDDAEYGCPTQVVRDGQYKLFSRGDGSVELYDWRGDSEETEDLSESRSGVVERLKSVIDQELGTLSQEMLSEEIEDSRLQEHLEDLGYM